MRCVSCKTEGHGEGELAKGHCEPCAEKAGIVGCSRCVEGIVTSAPVMHYNGFAEDVCDDCMDVATNVAGIYSHDAR